eukprot:COSAG02_NODE_57_length_43668_cov_118.217196_40_plen_44_part_00
MWAVRAKNPSEVGRPPQISPPSTVLAASLSCAQLQLSSLRSLA